uniref:AlNc14C441G11672 protein n=1 Tax=Albugo laibachii Nc14 TaxID=890382 RepID=F0WZT1_9STRA|nr:AlNc14C441G11672 [Albugo laibachii Nc14]CCA27837.1 AlNc14C730G12456 [Albugo laibachii Nc14]|eukprot:CCA27837.1 AlNc14C730G12456 [Albugo laibachii Nc14]
MDPLAILETEYQAVISQCSLRHDQIDEKLADDIENMQDKEQDQKDTHGYSPLCSSPTEDESSDFDEEASVQLKPIQTSHLEKQVLNNLPHCGRKMTLEPSKKEAIQKCMQNIRLDPPAKYQNSNLTDSQLLDLVHAYLELSSSKEIFQHMLK